MIKLRLSENEQEIIMTIRKTRWRVMVYNKEKSEQEIVITTTSEVVYKNYGKSNEHYISAINEIKEKYSEYEVVHVERICVTELERTVSLEQFVLCSKIAHHLVVKE